jgi:uncharacterized SAM-binding protein YcdF (DUF218 family)
MTIRRLLLAGLVGFVALVVASVRLFVWPAYDHHPQPADAIVTLAGLDQNQRIARTAALVSAGLAPVVLYSTGPYGSFTCPIFPGAKVDCFRPRPGKTAGEAAVVGRVARRHHWTRLILVTSMNQATRARILVQRCYVGDVEMVPSANAFGSLFHGVWYEWGALIVGLTIQRGCPSPG